MTDWEQMYQEGETPWDKGEPSPGLVDWLVDQTMEGEVLVPGCGLGHDVRVIAARRSKARVTGLDVSASAVNRASGIEPSGTERYVLGDLFNLPAEMRGAFDWVWEHTCFCAIDPSLRDDYVRAVHGALKPGAQYLAVFYLDPYDEEHPPETDHPPYGSSVEEIEKRFGDHFRILESWVPEKTYPGREGAERMMRMERLDQA